MSTKVLLGERFSLLTTPSQHRRTLPTDGSLVMRRKKSSTKHHHKSKSNTAAASAKKSTHQNAAGRPRKDDVAGGGLVMGKVTLLKRGESLSSIESKIPKSTESKETVPKKITLAASPPADIYAGTAFESSPSPRSLPQPTFFNRKEDAATRSLRRILRLE